MSQLGVADEKDDLLKGKSFVEMTSIDPETSSDFSELMSRKGGLYLEAMVSPYCYIGCPTAKDSDKCRNK